MVAISIFLFAFVFTAVIYYMALKSVNENNGWRVDLFAVEVGARGYYSRSVLCCLGLRNGTINNTIKQVSVNRMLLLSLAGQKQ